jgi:hypothetical protein
MYERGYYFDGASQLQLSPNAFQADGFVLAQNFAVLVWFKGTGSLLTLRPDYSEKISISIAAGILAVKLGSEQLKAKAPVHGETAWSFCSIAVFLKASEQSYVELRCLKELHEQVPSRYAKCVEFLSSDGGLIGDGFVGLIAEFTLINEAVSNLEAYTQTSSTPQSFTSSLSECGYSQYLLAGSSCGDCSSECKEGCRDTNDNCSQCDQACKGECSGFSEDDCCERGQVYSGGKCIPKPSSLTQQQKDEADTRARTKSAYSAILVGVLGGSFFARSPDIFVGMFFTLELISFLPLIDLSLTNHQEKLLTGSNQLSSLPDTIGGLECYAPASQHSSYSINCANFLRSSQKEALVITVLLFLYGLLSFTRRSEFIKRILTVLGSLIGKVLQSFVVDILVKAYLFTVFVRVISFQAILSWILCGVSFIGFAALAYNLIKEAFNAEASPLFQHPELKSGVLPRLYYAVLILHRVIYAVAVVCLDAPVVQLSILTVSTFLVTSTQLALYLITVRPYSSVVTQAQHFGSTLAVSLYFLCLLLRETGAFSKSVGEDVVTSGFIITVFSVLGVSMCSVLWSIGSTAKEIYHTESESLAEV